MSTPATAPLSSVRFREVTVTYLPDGSHCAPAAQLFPDVDDDRHTADTDAAGTVWMSVGSVLVEYEQGRVLVDLGNGPDPRQPSGAGAELRRNEGGLLLESLAQRGLTPADIDHVVFTHLHMDHIGWVSDPTASDRLQFPEASLHLHPDEWAFWSDPATFARNAGPNARQVASMRPHVRPITGLDVVGPVSVLPTPGHTPGHLAVVITEGEQRAIVLGDAMHCRFEMAGDAGRYCFDLDHAAAAASRARLRHELRQPGTWYVGAHFAEQVIGTLAPPA